ncbi:XRE family transcriptional regulator [Burkholderia catarinensis]|uniref:XRE family transcriptional regulator n=1 Tax=Burkholderia catarinensis TaxID=1108140 RepID=UPI00090EF9B4|nr:DNA-binding protein [Burkholderia catarinensis]
MTYCEFRDQLRRAQLTAREFANLVRMNENSITNYSQKGVVPSHLAVIVLLMGEMANHQIEFRDIIRQMEITHKKPRGAPVKRGLAATKSALQG